VLSEHASDPFTVAESESSLQSEGQA
jgi:hypothetical protein